MADKLSSIPERLVGVWRLVECVEIDSGIATRWPLGKDAVGQLVYTADGRTSVHLARRHRAAFASDDYRQASESEASQALQSYLGYFGGYIVDPDAGTVTHLIEGAWFPNMQGAAQVRRFYFDGNKLVLEAQTPWGAVRNVWSRT